MDNRKIDEILARERPKHRKIETPDSDSLTGSDDASDVEAKNLPVSAWKKQAAPRQSDAPAPKGKPMTRKKTGSGSVDELRERFRPKKLGQGGQPDAYAKPATRASEAGKIGLRRLKMGTQGADSDESMDVLIDEDDGIIGESDSAPEKKRR